MTHKTDFIDSLGADVDYKTLCINDPDLAVVEFKGLETSLAESMREMAEYNALLLAVVECITPSMLMSNAILRAYTAWENSPKGPNKGNRP